MSQFYVCDWCGEPTGEKPVKLDAFGGSLLGAHWVWDRELAHYHQDDERECYREAMAALGVAQEANKLKDAPAA